MDVETWQTRNNKIDLRIPKTERKRGEGEEKEGTEQWSRDEDGVDKKVTR